MNKKYLFFRGILSNIILPNNIINLVDNVSVSEPLKIDIYKTNFYIPKNIHLMFFNHQINDLKIQLRKYKIKKILNKDQFNDNNIILFIEFFLTVNFHISIIK